jgi:hypothetical protein
MAFSLLGIFSVLLEVLRPFLGLLIAVLAIDAVLLARLARAGGWDPGGPAMRRAATLGALAALLAFALLPYVTRTSHASLSGGLDWLALSAASAGMGLAVAVLAWPGLQWFLRRRPV